MMKTCSLLGLTALLTVLLCACGSASLTVGTEITQAPAVAQSPEVVTVMAATPEPVAALSPAPTQSPETAVESTLGSFSVVWVSDTQHYSELYPEMLKGMMQWAANNREQDAIQLLVHTGDIINRPGSTHQWEAVTEALDTLQDLPFLTVAGNHDVGTETGNYKPFVYYVGSRYPDQARLYRDGRGSYVTVGTEDCGFLFIGIGYGYTDESVEWMYETIQAHPLYTAVLCVHSYLNTNGSLTDGGEILYEKIVKRCPSVRLVLCGHRDDIAFLDQPFDVNGDGEADRHVYAMLYNYQEVSMNGGGGYLRELHFDLDAHSIAVNTYSPLLDAYKTGANEQFVIENAF